MIVNSTSTMMHPAVIFPEIKEKLVDSDWDLGGDEEDLNICDQLKIS